ncbi:LysR family transcriptional regulator [Alphaproteobacteria bacterium 46_93_T64]|nr:LysR family transcriptional regulator [Alphaproteobacteria bacterium 46_93_T64]
MSVAPPRPKGPHLNALRAFESAARLGSFTAAAEELCVTPGAIAQHIKSLEAWAESPLFARNTRGVVLTPLGEELLPDFSVAFDRLSEAVQALRTKAAPKKIRIATLPAIAQLWLSERLGNLRQVAPDISVSVIAVETMPNLLREPFDVTLFFEDGPMEKGDTEIFQDCIFPVCNPEIGSRLGSVSALRNETLLHDSTWTEDWKLWLSSVPGDKKLPTLGPVYSLFSVALEEARHGAGVLMAHEALVAPALESGELVSPFEHKLTLQRRLVMKTTPAFATKESCRLLKLVFCGKP